MFPSSAPASARDLRARSSEYRSSCRHRASVAAEHGADYQAAVSEPDAPGPGQPAAGQPSGTLTERLGQLRRELAELTGDVPEHADSASVEAWLAAFRPVEGAVAGLRARLVACVQASRAHDDAGHAGTTSFLRDHLGVSGREAKKQDAMARDLRQLPATRAALADGRIGPEQAQAIGRAARRGALGDAHATEEHLLPAAAAQASDEFHRHIRREEQLADSRSLERAEQRAYRRRRASLARRPDGMWDLHALLPDEDGELLATALDAFRTADPAGTPIPEQRSPEQRTADAFTDVVGAALRGGAPTLGGVRPHLNLVVPVELLEADSSEVASAGHGGQLSSAAVSRLLCDANLRRLLTRDDSEVLDLGRSRRAWTVAQRVALNVRDGGCRAPGCDRPVAWTEGHHIVWWTKGGVTSVDNGILLCRRHHRMVHEGGWSVELDVATALATFRSPTGREVVTHPHRGRREGLHQGGATSGTGPAASRSSASADGPAIRSNGSAPEQDLQSASTQTALTLSFDRPDRAEVRLDRTGLAREVRAGYRVGADVDHPPPSRAFGRRKGPDPPSGVGVRARASPTRPTRRAARRPRSPDRGPRPPSYWDPRPATWFRDPSTWFRASLVGSASPPSRSDLPSRSALRRLTRPWTGGCVCDEFARGRGSASRARHRFAVGGYSSGRASRPTVAFQPRHGGDRRVDLDRSNRSYP